MKPQKKPSPAERSRRSEENMRVLNDWKEGKRSVGFEWKSPIHLRITLGGKWTDFWPTTGKWYDPYEFKKGSDVGSLVTFLRIRVMGSPALVATPPEHRTVEKKTILERLAIIDQHINAIRTELRGKEPKVAPEFAFMDDELDTPPVPQPYDDSWAKGDPFEKDDDPPWEL